MLPILLLQAMDLVPTRPAAGKQVQFVAYYGDHHTIALGPLVDLLEPVGQGSPGVVLGDRVDDEDSMDSLQEGLHNAAVLFLASRVPEVEHNVVPLFIEGLELGDVDADGAAIVGQFHPA